MTMPVLSGTQFKGAVAQGAKVFRLGDLIHLPFLLFTIDLEAQFPEGLPEAFLARPDLCNSLI